MNELPDPLWLDSLVVGQEVGVCDRAPWLLDDQQKQLGIVVGRSEDGLYVRSSDATTLFNHQGQWYNDEGNLSAWLCETSLVRASVARLAAAEAMHHIPTCSETLFQTALDQALEHNDPEISTAARRVVANIAPFFHAVECVHGNQPELMLRTPAELVCEYTKQDPIKRNISVWEKHFIENVHPEYVQMIIEQAVLMSDDLRLIIRFARE